MNQKKWQHQQNSALASLAMAKSRGVTLIEVLATLVIIGITLGIAIPNYQSQLKNTKEQADQANVLLLEGGIKQFRLDTGIIPGDLQYLLENPPGGIAGWDGPYVVRLPESPAGTKYDIDPLTGKVLCL